MFLCGGGGAQVEVFACAECPAIWMGGVALGNSASKRHSHQNVFVIDATAVPRPMKRSCEFV
jgi:hypothetical protein